MPELDSVRLNGGRTVAASVLTGAEGTITVDDGPITALRKFYRIGILGAVRLLPTTGQLERSDDGYSYTGELTYHEESVYSLLDGQFPTTVPIGFTIKFFGVNYGALYINNNGNVTFIITWSHTSLFLSKPKTASSSHHIGPMWILAPRISARRFIRQAHLLMGTDALR